MPVSYTGDVEGWIDTMDKSLPPLKNFILPGATELSAVLHCARTVSKICVCVCFPVFVTCVAWVCFSAQELPSPHPSWCPAHGLQTCRRAERRLVELNATDAVDAEAMKLVNRSAGALLSFSNHHHDPLPHFRVAFTLAPHWFACLPQSRSAHTH